MRVWAMLFLAVAVSMAACKTRREVPVDTSESSEIPREVAIEKLGNLLPTAEYTYCTLPKHTFKQSEVRIFVRGDLLEIDFSNNRKLSFSYGDMTAVNLELIGKHYTARVYTVGQPDREKEHLGFQWRREESAKRAVELLASLIKNRPAADPKPPGETKPPTER